MLSHSLIMHFISFDLTFWDFWKILGFFKIDEVFVKFLVWALLNDFKWSCIASHFHYNNFSCILDVCLPCCNDCLLVVLEWAEPMMFLLLHITCSCIFMHLKVCSIPKPYSFWGIYFWFPLSHSILWWEGPYGHFGELFTMRHSFRMPSRPIGLFRY